LKDFILPYPEFSPIAERMSVPAFDYPSGHSSEGDKSAVIYSIVVSCQRHGIDPFAYLKDVLQKLPSISNQDDLTPLLPNNITFYPDLITIRHGL